MNSNIIYLKVIIVHKYKHSFIAYEIYADMFLKRKFERKKNNPNNTTNFVYQTFFKI